MKSIPIKIFENRKLIWDNESGSAAMIFGLAFIPIMFAMGAAIDYSQAAVTKSKLQVAVDAASISILKADPSLSLDVRQTLAQNVVNAQLGSAATKYNVSVTASALSNGYSVTATATVPTAVMKIAHINSIPISASAGAEEGEVTVQGGSGGCVLSLNESAVEALDWSGNADVVLKNCDIYGNSGSSAALEVSGSAKLTARKVSVHGNIAVQGGGVLLADKTVGQPRVADPYEGVALPSFSGCDKNGFSTNDGNITLSPGVYCNGLSINTNSGSKGPVKFAPGLYVIDGGQFLINSQAVVDGTGVTIVFTKKLGSSWGNARINGGAQVTLEAPKKDASVVDAIPGILMYGDRSMAVGTEFKLNGGSSQTLTGAIYLPEAKLTFNGGADIASGCLQIIADTLTFTGDTNVSVEGCGNFDVTSFGSSTVKYARVAY